MQLASHKYKISRGPEVTASACSKHFQFLLDRYNCVQIVNLLGQSPLSPEYVLTESYKSAVGQLDALQKDAVTYGVFDFHAIVRRDQYERLGELISQFANQTFQFGCSIVDIKSGTLLQRQTGILRTNCLDCLDRTNVVQASFAIDHASRWIKQLGINVGFVDSQALDAIINDMWADVLYDNLEW